MTISLQWNLLQAAAFQPARVAPEHTSAHSWTSQSLLAAFKQLQIMSAWLHLHPSLYIHVTNCLVEGGGGVVTDGSYVD